MLAGAYLIFHRTQPRGIAATWLALWCITIAAATPMRATVLIGSGGPAGRHNRPPEFPVSPRHPQKKEDGHYTTAARRAADGNPFTASGNAVGSSVCVKLGVEGQLVAPLHAENFERSPANTRAQVNSPR